MSAEATPPGPEAPAEGDSGSGELLIVSLLLMLGLLMVVLVIGRVLHKAKVIWIGEAGAALLLGLVVGLIIRAAGAGQEFMDRLAFNPGLFLYVLLPTIMFDAGYQLDPRPFLRNMGSVCAFAFLGTAMSTFVVGYLMYAFGVAGWCIQLGAIYNLLFGAIISATDPVTVLAIFSQLGANEDLYINVFGESVLNDAVAMVIYETLKTFVHNPVTVAGVWRGIGIFIGIFTGSVVFGAVVGFLAAILFRSKWFLDEETSLLETGMVVVIAFISYLGAQAAYMSGICSVVVCGMVMRSYVKPNLSPITQLRVEALFKVLAGLFELFLFVYIGLTLFLVDEAFNIWDYAGLMLIALAVSRACNIFPLSAMVNCFRLPQRRIPGKQQFMMWWSGLRGAMAFALAIDAADLYGDKGQVMKTCTFYIVFLTVIINGGSAGFLLEKLQLLKDSHQGLPLIADSDETDTPRESDRQDRKVDISSEETGDVRTNGALAVIGAAQGGPIDAHHPAHHPAHHHHDGRASIDRVPAMGGMFNADPTDEALYERASLQYAQQSEGQRGGGAFLTAPGGAAAPTTTNSGRLLANGSAPADKARGHGSIATGRHLGSGSTPVNRPLGNGSVPADRRLGSLSFQPGQTYGRDRIARKSSMARVSQGIKAGLNSVREFASVHVEDKLERVATALSRKLIHNSSARSDASNSSNAPNAEGDEGNNEHSAATAELGHSSRSAVRQIPESLPPTIVELTGIQGSGTQGQPPPSIRIDTSVDSEIGLQEPLNKSER